MSRITLELETADALHVISALRTRAHQLLDIANEVFVKAPEEGAYLHYRDRSAQLSALAGRIATLHEDKRDTDIDSLISQPNGGSSCS